MAEVLIVCGSGISSQFLKETAQRSTEAYHAPITFDSTSFSAAESENIDGYDLVLVAPQVSYDYSILKAENPRLETIPDDIYGWLNGESLVKFAMNELEKNKIAG
ncbi:PTS sugar transporter subunit IIB [Secundilactobacillus folii]|uniref:PTS lactose transporter subunit IIB n=1 Tax=Secundilactobacillus folii TaxID=2678357 RepID=A0A7X3C3Z0_9LACO|nr:PTS lactose transporter subunit IIB [Secundilactobacillus folii]MTV83337.1 PTS lactose transporter subunit IIB [Secundilactobacillus folii]